MKIRYLLIIGFVIIVSLVLVWFSREPSTRLVDAAGQDLTAGDTVGEDADVFGPQFDEVYRLIEEEEFDAAKAMLLELIEVSERDGEACMLLSEVTCGLLEIESAVDYGLKAVELRPESARAHLAYARALGVQMAQDITSVTGILGAMKRVDLFKKEVNRVIELDPDDIEARTMLTFYYMAPWPIGDSEKAIEMCGEIEARDPVRGKQLLALCYHQDEKTDQAIDLCLAAIEAYPEEKGLNATLADIYADEKRFSDADAQYEAARQGAKDDAYYRALYYQALMRVNNEFEPARAVELFDEFLAAEPRGEGVPSLAYACLRKGNALEQMNRKQEAREAYETSLAYLPGFEPAAEALQSLEN